MVETDDYGQDENISVVDNLFHQLKNFIIFNDKEVEPNGLFLEETQLNAECELPEVLTRLGNSVVRALRAVSTGITASEFTEATHLGVSSQGLAQYLKTALTSEEYAAVERSLEEVAAKWLGTLLKLNNRYRTSFQRTDLDTRREVCHAALRGKIPDFDERGLMASGSSMPVIYVSSTAGLSIAYLAKQMLLPSCIFKLVSPGSQGLVAKAQTIIASDKDSGLQPTLFIASAGMGGIGEIDDIAGLRQVCESFRVWLHAEGLAVAFLATDQTRPSVQALEQADSLACEPTEWFGLAGCTSVLFSKRELKRDAMVATKGGLECLPLVVIMQRVGYNIFRMSVEHSVLMAHIFAKELSACPSLYVVNAGPHIVVFRYAPNDVEITPKLGMPALNSANQNLLSRLHNTNMSFAFDSAENEGFFCVRFQPQFMKSGALVDEATISVLVEALSAEAALMDATVACRGVFAESVGVASQDGLTYVEVNDLLGLGAFRFIPVYLGLDPMTIESVGRELRNDVGSLNEALAKKLSETYPLFHAGKDRHGNTCVCLGVDTTPITPAKVREYVKAAVVTSSALELPPTMMKRLASVTRNAIEEAEKTIREKHDKQFADEGLLRHIPVVGSLWGMVSTVPEPEMAGCRFDITQGNIVESKDNAANGDSGVAAESPRIATTPTDHRASADNREKGSMLVEAGSTFPITVWAERGSHIKWSFSVEDKDIGFSVTFKKETSASGADKTVVPYQRVSHEETCDGDYVLTATGDVTLTWDNSFSYFAAKTVKYDVQWTDAPM